MARRAVLGAGILASGFAAIVGCTPEIEHAAQRAPETLPAATVPSPSAAPPGADVETVLAACPLVDRATLTRLRADPAVAALDSDDFTLLVLSRGDQGLQALGGEKVAEIGKAFGSMFAAMSSEERSAFNATISQLRAGRQPGAADAATALAALRSGADRLPAVQRENLRVLYSAAIDTGLAHQLAAAERTRSAVEFPAESPAPAPVAPGNRGLYAREAFLPGGAATAPDRARPGGQLSRPSRSAADWEARVRNARERVKRAERELEAAERPLPPDPPVVSGGVAVSSRTVIDERGRSRREIDLGHRGVIELRDEARRMEEAARSRAAADRAARVEARDRAIAHAKRELDEARAELSRLEYEARDAAGP
jgi:hypothetical protein